MDLNREQIERIKTRRHPISFEAMDALCDLALRGLEGQWRPIETAPKDGTRLLVCGPDKDGTAYQDVTGWPLGWTGKWPTAYMAYAADEPTHWLPLPAPPEGK